MVGLNEPDDMLAVREEEKLEDLLHSLGEAVIGEHVQVRARWDEVGEGLVLNDILSVVVDLPQPLVGVDPLVVVLAGIKVLMHQVLVLEVLNAGAQERAGSG